MKGDGRELAKISLGEMLSEQQQRKARRRLNGFDYLVIAGGAMNALVIVYLVGYWLLH